MGSGSNRPSRARHQPWWFGRPFQELLEPAQLDAICAHLPAELQPPVRFAYITAWRFRSEVLPLTADRVDLQVGAVRLNPGETKIGRGRTFMLTTDLRRILTTQIASLAALHHRGIVSGWVFHRADGTRILDCRKAWKSAATAMSMVGHERNRSTAGMRFRMK